MRVFPRWLELCYSFHITGSIRTNGSIAINAKFSKEYSFYCQLLGRYLCRVWDSGAGFHIGIGPTHVRIRRVSIAWKFSL